MRERYAIKYPRTGDPERSVGIVLVNHAGSNHNNDSGRDAQQLADMLHTITINADRPTSYRLPRSRKLARSLRNAPIKTMYGLARKLEKVRRDLGLNHMIVTGRSAGALGALELAQTGILKHIDFVYAAEPVGCVGMSVDQGHTRFKQYYADQRKWLDDDLAQAAAHGARMFIHPPNDLAKLPLWRRIHHLIVNGMLFFVYDGYYNGWHWTQPLVPEYLRRLTCELGIRTHVDFADHSLVLPADADESHQFVAKMRGLVGESGGQLSLNVLKGTTHASYNNRAFFAKRLWSAMARQSELPMPAPHFLAAAN